MYWLIKPDSAPTLNNYNDYKNFAIIESETRTYLAT